MYILAHNAASTLFGRDNRLLIQRVVETWNTNYNMTILAQCYRLDRFVGDDAKTSWELYRKTVKKQDKLWADFWEAWFGAVILERRRWGRMDMEDLVDIIRKLIYLQFEELIDKYSTNYRRVRSGLFPLRWFARLMIVVNLPFTISEFPSDQINVQQIKSTDETIKRYITGDNTADVYGYLATITTTTTSNGNIPTAADPTISIFAIDATSAKAKLLSYLKSTHNGISTFSRFHRSNLSCTRRLLVICDKLLRAR